ncbi:4'-phosphopantetheinyl transferase superfamily protein [Niveibacterium sp.]|uniref:4'-phosphopantetheinyl transferase family protein n=1 Tax=Niveibacterium sp. TaxID=2017444 RepID=UPI0035B3B326
MSRWPVHAWPLQGPPPTARCVVLALDLPAVVPRVDARAAVRAAARDYIAMHLGAAPESMALLTQPGSAPRVAGHAIGLSFSHEPGCSLIAVNWDGAVGVDLMRVTLPEDWAAVARDYLGPDAAAQIAAATPAQRAEAFSQAWTRLEAGLKLRGEALREWRTGAAPGGFRCSPLALAAGYVGTLALPA